MDMTLNGYAFPWPPDRWPIPKEEKFSGKVLTYNSAAFFSFGTSIAGKEIQLEWDLMPIAQFNQLNTIYLSDEQKVWDPGDGNLYNVEIVRFDGEYLETVGYDLGYRQNVKMLLMIMSQIGAS